MERIATDTFSFERIRKNGFVYVDKTAILKPMADGSIGTQFFIARPRRFGKSLAISTLQCLFEGRRELFRGLAIEKDWDWSKTYPVIRIDMGTQQGDTPEELKRAMVNLLAHEANRLGVALEKDLDPASVFLNLIHAVASRGPDGKCVILIDEYDKPLLNHLGDADVKLYQAVLKPFYGVIKYTEGMQRFALLTGVSKFSKVSIFSDLNNLNDFTMDARVATLFGYTHEEVRANFPEALEALGTKLGRDAAGTFAELVKWYDGYHFHHEGAPVFNPVSVGKCLASGELNPYWFETGTPTFLINLMKEQPTGLDNVEFPVTAFSVYEPATPNLLPLMYQTGYFTIKDSYQDGDDRIYKLGIPNLEVSKAFSESLTQNFSSVPDDERSSLLSQMVGALRHDDVDDMLDALSCFFANIPANITVKREKYYQTLFYAVFVLIGARTHAECWTNRGRVDAVVETPCGIYVFEFKLSRNGRPRTSAPTNQLSTTTLAAGTSPAGRGGRPRPPEDLQSLPATLAAEALAQIKEKGYHEKYLCQGKKVTLIGVAFDAEMRNLAEREIEVILDK